MNRVIKTINNQWQSHCHTFHQPWNIGERYAKKYFQAFIFSMEKRPSARNSSRLSAWWMQKTNRAARQTNDYVIMNWPINNQLLENSWAPASSIFPLHPFYRRGQCLRNRLVHFVKFAEVWSKLSSDNSSLLCLVTTEVVHLIQVVVQSEKGKI